MSVERCPSPATFLERTTAYRNLDPVATNVLGSVALFVQHNPHLYDEYWWWVVSHADDVVGAALRTAPFGLVLGPMPIDGARELARSVARADDAFPWLSGPGETVDSFLTAYRQCDSPGAARVGVPGRTNLLYELVELAIPDVSGVPAIATREHVALVEQWNTDFHLFVDGAAATPTPQTHASLLAKLDAGAVYLWSVDGAFVAMAAHAEPVDTPGGRVTRVGPVFTPEHLRGRGYASAVTAALSADLRNRGSKVMLHADADNPTSNGVYQRLGYRVVASIVQVNLDVPG